MKSWKQIPRIAIARKRMADTYREARKEDRRLALELRDRTVAAVVFAKEKITRYENTIRATRKGIQ